MSVSQVNVRLGLRDYPVTIVDRDGPAGVNADLTSGKITANEDARVGSLIRAVSIAEKHEMPPCRDLPMQDVD